MLGMFALLQAVVSTVCAKALGDGYEIMGYNAGWIFIILGIGLVLLFATKMIKIPKSIGVKFISGIVAVILIIGVAMVFVETPSAPTGDVTGLADLEFDIEATAVTTAGSYYPDTEYDEGAHLFTIPYRTNSTANTLYEQGDNSSYGDDPRLNFTIKADFPADATDNDLAIIYFEVVNPTLYVASDADNYVLTKTDDLHQATWTDQDSGTATVSGWTSGGIEETLTLNLDLELYEAGLSEADVFDPIVLNLKFSNQAGTWSETFQIQFICTDTWIGSDL